MENVLFANGFENRIDGLKTCTLKETNSSDINPNFILLSCFDWLILSWIYSTLTPEIIGQIIGYWTSLVAWTALENIFSVSSKAWVMQLRLEFQTIRKGSLSMTEYIMKIKNIFDSLAAIGEPMTERNQIL